MKKLAIAALFVGFTALTFGQTVEVKEKTEAFAGAGTQNGYYVLIPFATDIKVVQKTVKSGLKKWKGKLSDKEGYFVDDAKVKTVGENTFDVYGKVVEEAGGKIALAIAIDLGGAYVNQEKHPTEYREIKKLVHDIAVECAKESVEEQIKAQEKVVKDKKKEQEKLVSEKEKLENNIKDYEQKILEAKEEIKTNEGEQEKKKGEISTEETKLKEIQNRMNEIK